MSSPPTPLRPDFASFEVEAFEQVPGGRELALLRLEGRYRSRLARPLLEAALLVDDGLSIHRHQPLPASATLEPGDSDEDWLWKAAFAVSLAALEDPETAYVLEAGPGISIELSGPTPWDAPVRVRPQQRRRRGPVAVGRRAAAAAMLIALTLSPTTGFATAMKTKPQPDGPQQAIAREAAVDPAMDSSPDADPAAPPVSAKPDEVGSAGSGSQPSPGKPNGGPTAPSNGNGNGNGGNGGGDGAGPSSGGGKNQGHSKPPRRGGNDNRGPRREPREPRRETPRHTSGGGSPAPSTPLRNSDGSPSRSNPSFMESLPGPGSTQGVPNFVIQKFRVPIFLLPIYQAAGTQYGVRWEILAAINEIETDYGRNLNVSSAGALGWMQFMPPTWRAYGVDANKDGKRDPYNPVDAIFSAANYLKASGAQQDIRKAIFAYNHADWYVDSVMLRAKLLSGMPVDVVGSLTGLTEGRFPVAARASYADDINERRALKHVNEGENAANVVEDDESRNQISIYSGEGAPVVAVNDGVVKKISHSRKLGRYMVLQDAYGNRYTYSGLGSVERYYPVPKKNPGPSGNEARAVSAHGEKGPEVITKKRVFAHPTRPNARRAGGLEQVLDQQAQSGGFSTYSHLFTPKLGLNSQNSTLRQLRPGSRVIAGTVLGRVGHPDPDKAAHVNFGIRPAGKGAPNIDPKPILDGWKLLESTAIYRAKGKNVLKSNASIGQILMMSKPMLERRVLADRRIKFYEGGENDIRTGQIDRRVLATLAFLAESGMNPTVSSLKGNHGFYTASGNVSAHSSGNAVDISAINGIPIAGHQDKGGITEQAVRRLMTLQGSVRPQQIISLLDLGANTLSLSDHGDHIHVGFDAGVKNSKKLGKQAKTVLKPGQWTDLMGRLSEIENPVVPTSPSRFALPAKKHGPSGH